MIQSEHRRSHEALRCNHCGHTSRMMVIAEAKDTVISQPKHDAPFEHGTWFEIQRCPACQKLLLIHGAWHESIEDPEDWHPVVLLPEAVDRDARRLAAQQALDQTCMRAAVDEARRSRSERDPTLPPPLVGAVASNGTKILAVAHRGELKLGEHAEFTLLERKLPDHVLVGATVYTTLEPCTSRSDPKIPCVQHLTRRRIARVVIGMLDPDERIRGRGILALRKASIQVDLFPPSLMAELEEMNRDFISSREQEVPSARAITREPAPGDDRYVEVAERISDALHSLENCYAAALAATQRSGAGNIPEKDLRRWKYETLRFLDDNFESDEATPFADLHSNEGGAGPEAHLSSSYHAHREFLEMLRVQVDEKRLRIRSTSRPSGNRLPQFGSFTYRH